MQEDSLQFVKDSLAMAGAGIKGGAHHEPPSMIIPLAVGVCLFLIFTLGLNFWAKKKPKLGRMLKHIKRLLQAILGIMTLTLLSVHILDKLFGRGFGKVIMDQSHNLTIVCLILIATIIVDAITVSFFERRMIDDHDDSHNEKSFEFVQKLISFCIYSIGLGVIMIAFPTLREFGEKFLAGAGIFAIGISFIAKESVTNVLSGLLIIIFRPFKIGDIVKIGDGDEMVGHVHDITLRHTVIKNFKNKMVIVPNSIMNSEKIINYDIGQRETCAWVVIGISYDSDIDLAKRIMTEEILAHPSHIDIRTPKDIEAGKQEVTIRVIDLADSAVVLRAWAWAPDYLLSFHMKCELLESIKRRFDKEGIEIPFPQQVSWLKSKDAVADVL